MGSPSLNDIVWLLSDEGMNMLNLSELEKVSVLRDDEMCTKNLSKEVDILLTHRRKVL